MVGGEDSVASAAKELSPAWSDSEEVAPAIVGLSAPDGLGAIPAPEVVDEATIAARKRELDEKVRRAVEEAREAKRKAKEDSKAAEVTLVPQLDRQKAPCDLPVWCVKPNYDDIERPVDIHRLLSKGGSGNQRLNLGRRPWVLLGRRDKQHSGQHPDIELGSTRASRKHAVIMQNWKGQVFLMDLGSAHGSFLGNKKCPPHKPCEWKIDVTVYFADKSVEVFKLTKSDDGEASAVPAPAQSAHATRPAAPLGGVAAVAGVVPSSRLMPPPLPGTDVKILPLSSQKPQREAPLYPGEWDVPADGISEFYKL